MRSPLREILEPRDLLNPYLAASVAGRIGNKVELESRTARALDIVIGKLALSSFNLSIENDPKTDEGYRYSKLWHGTGRYRHDNGEVHDVLQNIADTGQIKPKLDRFDFNGPMNTVSLARSRVYARSYADMYGDKPESSERYGDSLFWACAFLGSVAIEASRELRVWTPKGYYTMMRHLGRAGVSEWYKKVNSSNNTTMVDVYSGNSDIENNYPVLFGVRDIDGIETSRAVAIHEVRADRPIDIYDDITHVEVPERNIEETRKVLGGVAIRSLESGEAYSARYSFTQHMHEVV